MANTYRYLIRVFVFVAVSTALAVSAHAAANAAKQTVEVRFSVFGTRALQGLAYMSETSPTPTAVKFYSVQLSSTYTYRGEPVIKFYNEAELIAALRQMEAERAANPRGPKPRLSIEPVAVCKLPPDMKNAVLLFFPQTRKAGESGGLFDVYPMDMDMKKVPAGHMVVINASGRDFHAQINSNMTKLTRGISQPFAAESGKISVKIARTEPEFQNVVSSDRWNLASTQRRLWVLFPMTNANDVLPDTRCLVDNVPSSENASGYTTAMSSSPSGYATTP